MIFFRHPNYSLLHSLIPKTLLSFRILRMQDNDEPNRQNPSSKKLDLIIPLYQDKKLRISSEDNHEELPKDPNLWDDYRTIFLKLEVIDVDSE
ncbi:Protein CBG28057 [Caenorhabditis briggsae]|uniref:Protein CBG28057 n=1 Tax=Caenorhabditis briggsae TaxID=6238 RepID=B6IGP7_CAEBR|nr:Protein CBG28057 [Caenorhabditis briggsae]CAR99077.1 Protein CBG28057 [Caenorhabditis briggsae]